MFGLVVEVLHAEDGHRAGENEFDGFAFPVGLFGGQVEQAHGSFDIDGVGGHRVELTTGRENGGHVVDGGDVVLDDETVEEGFVENIGLVMGGFSGQVGRQRAHIQGQQVVCALPGELLDEGLPNFSGGSSNQDCFSTHVWVSLRVVESGKGVK